MNVFQYELRIHRLLPLFIFLLPFPAAAHSSVQVPGMGDVAAGLIHPLTMPSHVLLLVGLTLLMGQRTPFELTTPMVVFVSVSGVALLLTTTGFIASVYPPVLICLALITGTLVALEKSPSPLVCRGLFGLSALAIGLDSGLEGGTFGVAIRTLLGTWIFLVVFPPNIAVQLSQWRTKEWQRIGVQVLGSWIIAISLLVLAFSFRK